MATGLAAIAPADFTIVLLCHSLTVAQDDFCVTYAQAWWTDARIARMKIAAVNEMHEAVPLLGNSPWLLLDGLWQITAGMA